MRDSGSRRVSVSHFFSFFLHPARAACNATHLLLAPVKPASAALPAYPWLPIAETTVSQPHCKTFFFFFSLPWLFLTHITSLISFSMWPWGRETVVPKQTVRDGNRWLTIRSVEASITPRRAGSSTGSCASVGKCQWVLVGPPAGLGSGLSAEKGRC